MIPPIVQNPVVDENHPLVESNGGVADTMISSTMKTMGFKLQIISAVIALVMVTILFSPLSELWNDNNGSPSGDDDNHDGNPNISDDDIDGDGIPNVSDDDIDGDGIPNVSDEDYTNLELGEWNSYFAESSSDLPVCDNLTDGRLYYIQSDDDFQACVDSSWIIIDLNWSTSQTTLTSLTNPLDSLGCDSGQTVQHGLDNGDGGGSVANGILETGEVDLSVTYCNRISYFEELRILKDINLGGESSTSILEGGDMAGENFSVVMGNMLYFEATDGNTIGLWKTDGTAQGTVLVKENIRPNWMVAVGNTLFFSVSDSLGRELWKSDGTTEGTEMVKDINPGGVDNTTWTVNSSAPRWLTEVNGSLFFTADDGTNGRELWVSDGTENGTVIVKDINSGNSSSFGWNGYSRLIDMGDEVYFAADDGINGTELWKSDGTTEGTVLIKDINNGGPVLIQYSLMDSAVIDDTLYFPAENALWKSDGTAQGTVLVKENIRPNWMVAVGNTVYFTVYSDGSYSLWKSDGSTIGTVLVKDDFKTNWKFAVGDTVYFGVDVGYAEGQIWKTILELWKSDGTTEGTVMVKDINISDSVSWSVMPLIASGDVFYFAANDGIHGTEIWRTESGEEGAIMVSNIFADYNQNCGGAECASRGVAWVTELGGNWLFFASDDVNGWEPWIATEFQDGSNYTITTEVIYSTT